MKCSGIDKIKCRYGIPITMNYGDFTFQHYVTGKYGFYYWNRISNIDTEFVFLDIGANQGLYTICAALNSKNISTFSFEPVFETFGILEKNIRLNGVVTNCNLFNQAISSAAGQFRIKMTNGHSGAATLAEKNHPNPSESSDALVDVIDGNALWELMGGIEAPIYVKIDVEGHEPTVIRELMNSDRSNLIKEVYYEVDEKWVSALEIQRFLEGVGFTKFQKFPNGWHYDVLAQR